MSVLFLVNREVKRVPLDFDWPLGEIWKGYLADEEDQEYGPPSGGGYQLWETCSEGSPITPPCRTLDALAEFADGRESLFGVKPASKDQWLQFFGEKVSVVNMDGRIVSGKADS